MGLCYSKHQTGPARPDGMGWMELPNRFDKTCQSEKLDRPEAWGKGGLPCTTTVYSTVPVYIMSLTTMVYPFFPTRELGGGGNRAKWVVYYFGSTEIQDDDGLGDYPKYVRTRH